MELRSGLRRRLYTLVQPDSPFFNMNTSMVASQRARSTGLCKKLTLWVWFCLSLAVRIKRTAAGSCFPMCKMSRCSQTLLSLPAKKQILNIAPLTEGAAISVLLLPTAQGASLEAGTILCRPAQANPQNPECTCFPDRKQHS